MDNNYFFAVSVVVCEGLQDHFYNVLQRHSQKCSVEILLLLQSLIGCAWKFQMMHCGILLYMLYFDSMKTGKTQ